MTDQGVSWNECPPSEWPDQKPSVSNTDMDSLVNVAKESRLVGPEDEVVEDKHIELLDVDEQEIKVDLNEQLRAIQADPNSPLYSATTFEDKSLALESDLLKGIYSMKFTKPSRIQEKVLPLMRSNPPMNLIAQSQSGTGKTAAFTLGMLSRINTSENYPQALCLSPARELTLQIGKVVSTMGQYLKVNVALAVREDTNMPRGYKLNDHIIVGTPGTVLNYLKNRVFDPKKLKVFVLDEADEMLAEQGMVDQTIRIKKQLSPSCQMLLFSATFPNAVQAYARRVIPNPNIITLPIKEQSLDAIKQYWMEFPNAQAKLDFLGTIYGLLPVGQLMVFVNQIEIANFISSKLRRDGHNVGVLHGSMKPSERERSIDAFRNSETKVLVTTNVLSRGVDFPQVRLVINFDMPMTRPPSLRPDPETYLHRIGRTGRFGRTGVSINFCMDKKSKDVNDAIERHFNRPIVKLDVDDLEAIEKLL